MQAFAKLLKHPIFHAASFGIFVFLIYCSGLAPSIPGGDSGDFLTAICQGGIPHPPGYPLYVLLGIALVKGAAYLGLHATPAFLMNLFSAFFSAATCCVLFLTALELSESLWISIWAAGSFTFAPIVWKYSLVSEVLSLNNFFASLLFYFFALFLKAPKPKIAMFAFLIFGLAMSNHHTILFIAIPIALSITWTFRQNLKFSFLKEYRAKLAGCIILLLLGLSPYAYLAFVGATNLATSWGQTDTWSGFLIHILRQEFGTFQLSRLPEASSFFPGAIAVVKDLFFSQTLVVGSLLYGVSLLFWKTADDKRRSFLLGTLFSSLSYFLVFFIFTHLSTKTPMAYETQLRFLNLLLVPFLLSAAIACDSFFRRAKIPKAFLIVFVMACVGLQLSLNYSRQDQSQNTVTVDYARAHLSTLPPKSLLLVYGDGELLPINYVQACEAYRSDVRVLSRYFLKFPWMREHIRKQFPDVNLPNEAAPAEAPSISELIKLNYDHKIIFIADLEKGEDTTWLSAYTSWPIGFSSRVIRRSEAPTANQLLTESDQALSASRLSRPALVESTSWEGYYLTKEKEMYSRLAWRLHEFREGNSQDKKSTLDLEARYLGEYLKDNPIPSLANVKEYSEVQTQRQNWDPLSKEEANRVLNNVDISKIPWDNSR